MLKQNSEARTGVACIGWLAMIKPTEKEIVSEERRIYRRSKRDIEGEILKLGWNTESTGSRMCAERAGYTTAWHGDWESVLAEIVVWNMANSVISDQVAKTKDAKALE